MKRPPPQDESTTWEDRRGGRRRDSVVSTPIPLPSDNVKNEAGSKRGSTPFQRRDLIDRVKKHFSRGANSHGALGERVVLYGRSGQGKRTIAAQVAKEITEADGRRLLWINGISFIPFVRDYCLLYHELTGKHLPRGLGLAVTLAKIKHLLEERRQEWFMVIADLGLYSDDEPELASSLPNRGHVLVTSSDILYPDKNVPLGIGPNSRTPICALKFANNATEVYVDGLANEEIQQLTRELCPSLLNVTFNEFGKMQRYARGVPLFLRLTMINLQLLKVDFAAYRRLFEKQFDHRQIEKYQHVGWQTVCVIAYKMMWDALGDYDLWAQRLLVTLTVAEGHAVPLRLLEKLPVFSRNIADHLSPALDLLTSLGLVNVTGEPTDQYVSVMHHEVSHWVWKHLRLRSREQHLRIILSWVSVLSTELASQSTTVRTPCGMVSISTPYDIQKVWSLLPLIEVVVMGISGVGRYIPSRENPVSWQFPHMLVLNFLVHVAETVVADRRVPFYVGMFSDEAYKVLLVVRHLLYFGESQLYFLRIKHVRIQAYLALNEHTLAEQDLRIAKRNLRILEAYVEKDSDEWIFASASGDPVNQSMATPAIPNTTTPAEPSTTMPTASDSSETDTAASLGDTLPPPFPSLVTLTRRTEDLEVQILLSQQRYNQALALLVRLLCPPVETSYTDPYVLAQRYSWCAYALSGYRQFHVIDGEALRWSHAAMCVWITFNEDERWGKGARVGVEVLAWVERHTELLMEMRKFKGALLFLPKLLDVWQDLIPMGDGKVWRLARRVVECYVNLNMVVEAEEVVERMLEILNGSLNGISDLSGFGGSLSGGGYENETIGDGDGREMFWWMLVELARGYCKIGSVVVAEGLMRFCLGSWRRRHVGEMRQIEIIPEGNATEEQRAKYKKEQEEVNQKEKDKRNERESTWRRSAPADWWTMFISVLVMQGKVEEPKRLAEELVLDGDDPDRNQLESVVSRRVDAYQLMIKLYERAIWAEEDGRLKEWKMLLGESRDRFLLRRAVKAFGSVTQRVREKRDLASDIDLNLFSQAKQSKILHLLDRNWGHRYGFSPRSRWDTPDYIEDVTTPLVNDQRHICDYWRWCQCKRMRSRAWSIDYAEYVQKHFILEDEMIEQRPKPLRQTTLDNWFYLIVPSPSPRPQGCSEDCPCINANIAGLAQQATLEKKLWTYTEPTGPWRIPMPKTPARYKNPKDRPKCNELSRYDMDFDTSLPTNDNDLERTWKWYQPEFSMADYDDENYIVPWALDMPAINITLIEDESEGEESAKQVEEKEAKAKDKGKAEVQDEAPAGEAESKFGEVNGKGKAKVQDESPETEAAPASTAAPGLEKSGFLEPPCPEDSDEARSLLRLQTRNQIKKIEQSQKQKQNPEEDQEQDHDFERENEQDQEQSADQSLEQHQDRDHVQNPTHAHDQIRTDQQQDTSPSQPLPHSTGNNTFTKKAKKRKSRKHRHRSFTGEPYHKRKEDIKPYLTMDAKTKKKYDHRAKKAHQVVVLDEYYMPIETVVQGEDGRYRNVEEQMDGEAVGNGGGEKGEGSGTFEGQNSGIAEGEKDGEGSCQASEVGEEHDGAAGGVDLPYWGEDGEAYGHDPHRLSDIEEEEEEEDDNEHGDAQGPRKAPNEVGTIFEMSGGVYEVL